MADLDSTADDAPAGDGWESDEKIIEHAKRQWKYATDYWAEWRQTAEDELLFYAKDQYPDEVRRAREAAGRPVLTMNRIQGFVRQITNEQRQNRPQIRYSPAEDGPDQQAAETMTGLGRQIQVSSDADAAYDTAFEHAVIVGRGFFRMLTDYADSESFAQEIKFRRVPNPLSIVYDPASREADGSDARFAFDHEVMDRKAFKRQYPGGKDDEDDGGQDEFGEAVDTEGWWDSDTVRIAEYYFLTWDQKTLYLQADGLVSEVKPEGDTKAKSRKVTRPVVRWVKLTATRVLEKTIVPGEFIPVFPVYGAELDTGKKVDRWGVVRLLKDPQTQHNAMQSALTERIQLSPKAPYVGPAEAIAGHEAAWRDAGTSNDMYLPYNGADEQGNPIAPPQRQQPIDLTQGVMVALKQSVDDMKAVVGLYDASLGNQGNEQSGRAILQRQKQSGTTNFHFQDNLARILRHAGRVMAQWIPLVYQADQAVRILGEDGKSEFRTLTADTLGLKYAVVADVGPSYNTRRQQGFETAQALVQAFPDLIKVAGDLIVRQSDMPLAEKIADRLEKTLSPELREQPPGGPAPIPPEVQQQVQQLDQLVQTLTQENEQLQSGERVKMEQIASTERIARLRAETDIYIADMKVRSDEAGLAMAEELKHMRERESQLPPEPPSPPGGDTQNTENGPPSEGLSTPDDSASSPAGESGTPAP